VFALPAFEILPEPEKGPYSGMSADEIKALMARVPPEVYLGDEGGKPFSIDGLTELPGEEE
jgi:hypothetical protein